MRLSDDYEQENRSSGLFVITALLVTIFVAVLLGVVLLFNREPESKPKEDYSSAVDFGANTNLPEVIYPEAEELVGTGDKLKPEDLDFWDKYPEKEPEVFVPQVEEEVPEEVENDPATDGRHTKIINEKGEEEWILISPYLPKHSYDFANLVSQSGIMKYYTDGKQTSYVGVDLSKNQDYVDFGKVKKSGIDFAMLRLGSRGYGTGQISLDDYFMDNARRAEEAGVKVGAYFFSQAISEEEAVEEAKFVLEQIVDLSIDYPIAFDMEKIANDTSRIDDLGKSEKTKIAKAFLETITAAGYKVVLMGTKEWLIKEIDYSKLTAYDIWLVQEEDIPDYPYRFTMWQYSRKAVVDGISGYVNLNISFIDYAEK